MRTSGRATSPGTWVATTRARRSGTGFSSAMTSARSPGDTHQGGLVIFVMEGNGYSTVNGVAVDWKKYDVILLPMIPELCEHQHFNKEPGKPAVWCAFIYEALSHEYANDVKQNTDSPDFNKP